MRRGHEEAQCAASSAYLSIFRITSNRFKILNIRVRAAQAFRAAFMARLCFRKFIPIESLHGAHYVFITPARRGDVEGGERWSRQTSIIPKSWT